LTGIPSRSPSSFFRPLRVEIRPPAPAPSFRLLLAPLPNFTLGLTHVASRSRKFRPGSPPDSPSGCSCLSLDPFHHSHNPQPILSITDFGIEETRAVALVPRRRSTCKPLSVTRASPRRR